MGRTKPMTVQVINCLCTVLVTSYPLSLAFLVLLTVVTSSQALEVLWAVNSGGHHHIDQNGIQYMEDPLRVGISSDYGKALSIQRVARQDAILYQLNDITLIRSHMK